LLKDVKIAQERVSYGLSMDETFTIALECSIAVMKSKGVVHKCTTAHIKCFTFNTLLSHSSDGGTLEVHAQQSWECMPRRN
jgi:hypothetical protein